jgi:hypothetical protein
VSYDGLSTEAMEELAGRAASSICKRIAGSSWEDLKQDGILWMLSHEHKLIEWSEDPDQGMGKTYRSVYHELLDLAQRDKALRTGYHHLDNFYYSMPMLRRILPLYYLDRHAAITVGMAEELDLPDRDAYLDIELGLKKVTIAQRQALQAWFGEDRDLDEVVGDIMSEHECSYEAGRKRVDRTLAKLQNAIGGPAPSTHVGRKAVSNATARAAVANAYDPG